MSSNFAQIATKIIKEQELIIGPIAWEEASRVSGLHVDTAKHEVAISGAQAKSVIDHLVAQYERLFGRASKEVCREAVQDLISEIDPAEVPESLK